MGHKIFFNCRIVSNLVYFSMLFLLSGAENKTNLKFNYHYPIVGPDLPISSNACPVVGDWDMDGDIDLAIIGLPYDFCINYNIKRNIGFGPNHIQSFTFLRGLTVEGLVLYPGDAFDWDGDKDLDLVLGSADGQIILHENTQIAGTPIFFVKPPWVLLNTGSNEMVIPAVADWNRDGRPDLIVGYASGQIGIFLQTNKVAKSFAPCVLVSLADGTPVSVHSRAAPEVVDWNGDGHLDILAGNMAGEVWLFLGTSNAYVQSGQVILTNNTQAAVPKVADLNADHKLDLILGGADGTVVFYPIESGCLGQRQAILGNAFINHLPVPQFPSVVDWNSDGVPDLIFSGARLYKNTGKHLLPEFNEESIRIASGPRASSCVVDWDNDGDFDILYVDQTTYEVQWLENIGTESHPEFKSEGQPVLIGQQPLKTEKLRGTYVAPWGNTVKLCVFDWNGDGKQDLLLGGTNLRVCLNKSQTKGQTPLLDKLVPINELGGQALQFPSSKPIIGLAMGDVDNDGKKDLIISSYSIVNWYRNVGSINVPEFVRAQKIKDLNDGRNTTLQVIDWNRDGLNDILVNRQEGNQPKVRLFSQVPIAELEKPAPSAHAQGANIIIGPYLQNVGTNRIAVCWETDAPANGRVEYGLAAAESKPQVIKTGTNAIRHEVVLNNLQPGQFYNYCVSSGTITSRTSRFTTAPAGPTSFSFVVYSDAQRANYDHVKVIQRITELNPKSFILYCGDQCKFETFIYLAANIFRQVSFFPCIGNTDLSTSKDDKFTDFKQYYALPGNERYYSFDYGQAHFTAVNTFENCKPDSKQYVWLEKDLQLAVQSSLFVFVYFHIPPYSSGTHGQQTASLKLRALQPLFEKYKVDVVFNGHDHAYEHCLVNGVHYIVTGGGSQTRNVGKTKWTVYSEKTLECLLVSVAAQTARIVGVRPDGTKFDCFTIIKQDR